MGRGYRRARIAWKAAGLFAALDAASRGDPRPLEWWMEEGYPALVQSLRRSGCGSELADEVASAVVAKAYEFHEARGEIRRELRWMSAVAANIVADEARARRRHRTSLSLSLSLSLSWRFP